MNALPLHEAAAALDAMAAGCIPDRAELIVGALTLKTLCIRIAPDRDLLDAAGKHRAAQLAAIVRKLADA